MSITMGESSMANSFHTLPGIGSGPADLFDLIWDVEVDVEVEVDECLKLGC